jgi:hypothetical protein
VVASKPAAAPPSPPAADPAALDDDALTDRAQALVAAALPGAPLYVANAIRVEDRAAQRPLWKAHRARMLASGDFRGAFAVAAVVQALAEVPNGSLLAVLVVRDGGDLLVWFDLRSGAPIAALDGGLAWGLAFG